MPSLRALRCSPFLCGIAGFWVVLLLVVAGAPDAAAQEAPPESGISAEELVDRNSVLGGRDAPQWHPDGSMIAFMSTMRGSLDLLGLPPDADVADADSAGAVTAEPPSLVVEDLSLVGTGTPGSQKPQFSPDGRFVAYVSSKEGSADDPTTAGMAEADGLAQRSDLTQGGDAPEIWLRDLDAGTDRQLTALGSRINALRWSPDSQRILFTSDRYGSQDVWIVEVESGEATRLTADSRYEVYPDWHPSGEEILYVQMDTAWTDHTVLRMPATGGTAEVVVRDTAFFDYRAGLAFGTPLISPDGEWVLFRSLRSGWHGYWVVPYEGTSAPVQIAAAEADQSHARWSPSGDRIVYLENHNGTIEVRTVEVEGDQAQMTFGEPTVVIEPSVMAAAYGREQLTMGEAEVPEWSPDGRKISFTYSTPVNPTDLFVWDLDAERLTRLTRSAGPTDQLAMPEKVSYESTDGYTIHGYYHAPQGIAEGEEAPALVWVHGGPTSQFSDGYGRHHQVYYFATRGYAVLMPNVRGSSGYGKAFEDANNGCWGRCDLEDVRAGTEWLSERPEVAEDKLGITGTSYGGILSMAAVAYAPELFQAAIPISGYGNMAAIHTEVPELQHIKLLNYELGPYPENEEVYERHSSINYVEDATTPTFLIHGEGRKVPWRPEQRDPEMASINFARALDRYYKIFRYKAYPGESYYVYGRENTIAKLQDMNAFLNQFLRDGVTDRSSQHDAPEQ